MSQITTKIAEIFSTEGLLSKKIPGYAPRAVQLEMAIAVNEALEQYQVLIAEAGTGTGKTFAYLIPSLLSRKKIIISTGTKNLQDQLFYRDIPLIRKALGIPLKIALLKGRSNYLCLYRLNTYDQIDFLAPKLHAQIHEIKKWSSTSEDGEIERVSFISQDSSLWPYVTSTAENCLGQDCNFFAQCFLVKARRLAQEADLLIINHHLFFADNHLRDTGFAELLPNSHAIIFDEAHQLPEIATHFLGESISSRQLIYLAGDIKAAQQVEASDMDEIKLNAEQLILDTRRMLVAFGTATRGPWENIVNKPQLKSAIQSLKVILSELQKALEVAAIRGHGLDNCWRRVIDLNEKFIQLTDQSSEEQIHWYEVSHSAFSIHHTPLHIADYFQELMQQDKRSWIFTSATLSIGGSFSHFENHLGIPDAKRLHLESPFNYSQQALLYIPSNNYEPHEEYYTESVVKNALPLLELTQGKAFLLFTSHKALKEAATLLKNKIPFPLLIQGTSSKSQLLETFCASKNAVLLGTSSFWEGVDVKGSGLSCVIIDKIPFSAPDDPILKARIENFKRVGKNPFTEYQLPHAVIILRQGAGRLIRDVNDRGVLVICDPRLLTKEYGKVFLESLPNMPVTQDFKDVVTFFSNE